MYIASESYTPKQNWLEISTNTKYRSQMTFSIILYASCFNEIAYEASGALVIAMLLLTASYTEMKYILCRVLMTFITTLFIRISKHVWINIRTNLPLKYLQ